MDWMPRRLEPELMDDPQEARVYAEADFSDVNAHFVRDLLELAGRAEALLAVDLGCGPADIPLRIHRERPHWSIIAIDAAPVMLRLASASFLNVQAFTRLNLVLA